jgi:uncharacterized protein
MDKANMNYVPSWWLPNGHLQTIIPTLYVKKSKFPTRVERFELPDGDYIDGTWTDKLDGPIVILLHGLQGSTESHYINSLMHYIHYETNWNALALSFRGCGQEKQRIFRQYHSGDTEDIKFILNLIKQRNPDLPVSMVGYSLGGNILLKLFGELKYRNLCETGIAVSPPFDLKSSATKIQKGIGPLYQKIFLDDIKHSITNKYAYYGDTEKLESELQDISNLIELDRQFTAPMHGFKSVDEYYHDSSSLNYLATIKTPTLIVLALDDPIINYEHLPDSDEISSHVTLEVYDKGGHVGFMSGGIQKPYSWINSRIMSHLSQHLPLGIQELTD